MDGSRLVVAHGLARVGAGLLLVAAPPGLRRLVVGTTGSGRSVRPVLAALGARDVLVGERLLSTRDDWPEAVRWLRRAAALDAVDAAAFALARRNRGAAVTAALTAVATLATAAAPGRVRPLDVGKPAGRVPPAGVAASVLRPPPSDATTLADALRDQTLGKPAPGSGLGAEGAPATVGPPPSTTPRNPGGRHRQRR
jgi:hypothetical protein